MNFALQVQAIKLEVSGRPTIIAKRYCGEKWAFTSTDGTPVALSNLFTKGSAELKIAMDRIESPTQAVALMQRCAGAPKNLLITVI